jgi:hypothetical protein
MAPNPYQTARTGLPRQHKCDIRARTSTIEGRTSARTVRLRRPLGATLGQKMKRLSNILEAVGVTCLILLSAGCHSATLYHGQVMDQETGNPVSGIEVRGHYLVNAKFSPSLDGVFTRNSKAVSVVTDQNGRFAITLGGYNRSLAVFHAAYATAKLHLDKADSDKDLVLNLQRTNEGRGPNHTSDGIRQPADGLPKPSR